MITNLKQEYYKNVIEQNKNNSKKLWQTINNYNNISKAKSHVIKEVLDENNYSVTDMNKIVEIFNKHYSKIGKKMAHTIRTNNDNINTEHEHGFYNNNSIFLRPVSEEEIKELISSLKNYTSPGFDSITSNLLKEISNEIAKPMSHIINLIFENGKCPEHFKIAIIKPVYKTGDRNRVENYRPISLVSNMTKIFEKAIKTRLVDFLTKNNILSKFQFGFTNKKSTNDSIALLVSKINKSLDNSRACAGVFIDLAKAFDTVSHRNLLTKLYAIGVRGAAHSLFQSYLEKRQQMVQINGTTSNQREVTFGIPQGTVLGPILFIIYLNELLALNCSGTIISFADDTVLFVEDDSWDTLENKISLDLQKIVKWFDNNLLTINLEKTKYLPFANYKSGLPKNKKIDIDLPFRKNTLWRIESTDHVKYLGIIIDCNLRWDLHIQGLTKKLRSLMYLFKKMIQIVDKKNLIAIYHALVQSLLIYGLIGWGSAYATTMKPLEVAQRRILKIIYELNIRHPSDQIFTEYRILNIRKLYYKTAIMYLIKNRLTTGNTFYRYNTRFRQNDNLILPKVHLTIGQRHFEYVGQKVFNYLPQELKNKKLIRSFNKLLSQWLIDTTIEVL